MMTLFPIPVELAWFDCIKCVCERWSGSVGVVVVSGVCLYVSHYRNKSISCNFRKKVKNCLVFRVIMLGGKIGIKNMHDKMYII